MKICWDNLEKLKYSIRTGHWRHNNTVYRYNNSCKNCDEPFLYVKRKKEKEFCSIDCANKYNKKPHTEETKKKIGLKNKGRHIGNKSPLWKGGSKDFATFDTFSSQVDWIEDTKRNSKNLDILEVRCTYCGKWYIPTYKNVQNRVSFLKGLIRRESRFYCSDGCKKACPIFNQKKYTKGYSPATTREVQPQLRQMVFERDEWICQKCESTNELHCHHIYPVATDPLLSADIDNCITLCNKCHKKTHKKDGCKYGQLRICI